MGKDEEKIHATWYLYDKWKTAAGWNIKIKPGLIHFKNQGYKTDAQLREINQFWIAIFIALLASTATAMLTVLFA